ncbi:MAG: tetratricopeptide repeat protein [Desulfatitalea sp.]|nr:tetratricopeptide repeat protein [Desulfatitalea sp.]NNK02852.1 tetratricopeptide repeat protein [Desulfatitalea sp.]
MHPRHRLTIACLLAGLLLACTTGPPQPRPPEHVRRNTYYMNKGVRLYNKGCFGRALIYFQRAHRRYTAVDDLEGVCLCLNNIADIYMRTRKLDDALLVYDDAIEVAGHLNDTAWQVRAMGNKAAALIELDRLTEADLVLDQADAVGASGVHPALRLKTRALLQIKRGDLLQARKLLKKALAEADSTQEANLSSVYYAMGHIGLLQNDPDDAVEQFERALHLDQKTASYWDIASDLAALGRSHARMEDHAQAVHYFKRSAKIYALLQAVMQTESIVVELQRSAVQADLDPQATLHWVDQWLSVENNADLCK